MRASSAALARHSAVALVVLAVLVEALELINELLAEGAGAVLALGLLVLVVAAADATRKRGAGRVDLLQLGPEGKLHQHTGMTAVGAFVTLLGHVADDDVARVLCA